MIKATEIELPETEKEKVSVTLWLSFAVCFLGNVFGGMSSTLMSAYLPATVRDLQGATQPDQLVAIGASINALYFVGWAIGGLTWGVISDRIGRARSLSMLIGLYGLFTVLISFSSSWEMLMLFRFFCGFSVGGMMVVNTTLLSETWPEKTRAVFIGILSIGFPVGIFSSGVVTYLVSSWRQGFMIGFVPCVLALLSLVVLKESEKWKLSRNHSQQKAPALLSEYRSRLINGSIIFGSMLIGLWAIFSWVPTWVQSLLTNSDGQAERGLCMMLLGAGGLTGGFFSGWVSNNLGVKRAMTICFSGCFIMSFVLFRLNTVFSPVIYAEIVVLSLFFGISQGLLAVYIPLLFPVSIRATATGFCFNIGRFVTAAAVFFVGFLVNSLGGYGNSLLVFSCVFLFGLTAIYFSPPQKGHDAQ